MRVPISALVDVEVDGVRHVDVIVLGTLWLVLVYVSSCNATRLTFTAGRRNTLQTRKLNILRRQVIRIHLKTFTFLRQSKPISIRFQINRISRHMHLLLFRAPIHIRRVHMRNTVNRYLRTITRTAQRVSHTEQIRTNHMRLTRTLPQPRIRPHTRSLANHSTSMLIPQFHISTTHRTLHNIRTSIILRQTRVQRPRLRRLHALPILLRPTAVIAVRQRIRRRRAQSIHLLSLRFLLRFGYRSQVAIPTTYA